MKSRSNLEWYKINVNLVEIMQKHGFAISKGSTMRDKRMTRVQESGDKEVFVVRRNKLDHQTYWSPFDDTIKGSTIIDFVMSEYGLVKMRDVVRRIDHLLADKDVTYSTAPVVRKEQIDYNKYLARCTELRNIGYLESRGISKETVMQPMFKRVLKNLKGGKAGIVNIAAVLYNATGVCGLQVKNDDYVRTYGDRQSGIFLSGMSNDSGPLDQLYITESFEDCIAGYELLMDILIDTNVRFVGSCGSLSSDQVKVIDQLCFHHKPHEIILAFDNDINGIFYATKLIANTKYAVNDEFKINEHLMDVVKQKDVIRLSVLFDTSISSFSELSDGFKEITKRQMSGMEHQIIEVDNGLELVTGKRMELVHGIFETVEAFRLDGSHPYLLAEIEEKDYNDDLKALKGIL